MRAVGDVIILDPEPLEEKRFVPGAGVIHIQQRQVAGAPRKAYVVDAGPKAIDRGVKAGEYVFYKQGEGERHRVDGQDLFFVRPEAILAVEVASG